MRHRSGHGRARLLPGIVLESPQDQPPVDLRVACQAGQRALAALHEALSEASLSQRWNRQCQPAVLALSPGRSIMSVRRAAPATSPMTALNTMASQYASPQQLDAMLGALEQDLPALVAAHPSPGEFWNAFMRRVDPIEDSACDDDTVLPRLNAMLAPYGMRIAAVE